MHKYRTVTAALLGLCLLASGGAASPAAAAATTLVPPLASGMARVWFLRPSGEWITYIGAADPTICANGTTVGRIAEHTDFFRDFAPGTYRFTVQPYGEPTGQSTTLGLTPGSQTYLEVQWASRWELGYASSGQGPEDHAFAIWQMTPELARIYLPSLTYRGGAVSVAAAQPTRYAAGPSARPNAATDPLVMNQDRQTTGSAGTCPAGWRWVAAGYSRDAEWSPAHCERIPVATGPQAVDPTSQTAAGMQCPSGFHWVEGGYNRQTEYVSAHCAQD
jgi:hypothetical protein